MSRLMLIAALTLASCARRDPAATTLQVLAVAERPTLVYFVRHAEKALDQGPDPELTEAGTARAHALDVLLAHAGVTHLYSTEYKRTALTLAPLSDRLRLPIKPLSAKDPRPQLDALRALAPGSVAVVAGHSNTVPQMVRALGGAAADLDDADYDRLLVVALSRTGTTTEATTSELRFGAPSPD